LAGCAVGRWSAPAASGTPVVAPVEALAVSETPQSAATERVELAPPATAAVSHSGSVRDLLEREYGLPWSEIRGLLADPDADPEKHATLLSWTEAAPHIRQSLLFRDAHSGDVEVTRALRLEGTSEQPNFYG